MATQQPGVLYQAVLPDSAGAVRVVQWLSLRLALIKKTNSWNPGDSANPDTTKIFCFFAKIALVTE
jgi:hypothetical protein